MITKERMQALASYYRSRYNAMQESGDKEDLANSEACRLAARAWRQILAESNSPDYPDFSLDQVIETVEQDWARYLENGIVEYDADRIVAEPTKILSPSGLPPASNAVLNQLAVPFAHVTQSKPDEPPEFDPKTGKRLRPPKPKPELVQASPVQSDPVQPAPVVPPEPPKPRYTDEQVKLGKINLAWVSEAAIREVVEVIRSEMGIDQQEAEVASSFSTVRAHT